MFYQKEVSQVFKECQSNQNGLTDQEVEQRHQQFGYNVLDEKKKESPFVIFLKQFQDLLVIILIIAAIISGVSGQLESTLVIVAVIIVNAILGTVQTLKAEKSLESLKKLSVPKAKVIRNGSIQEIDSTELTIGDIVQIEAGDIISGDGRIIQCSSLQINESALTGEVESVDKITDVIHEKVVVGDQKNMAFSGSLVTNGTGRYIVTSIGMQTEIGKIASMLNEAKERKTPLQKSLDEFSGKLSIGIMIICVIVLCLNLFLAKQSLLDSLMIAVALAVAAIPEALSSIVTIVLSMSTQKMVKENAIIKNLNSVESLGCVSVICSDKTGTLTYGTPKVIAVKSIYPDYSKEDIYTLCASAEQLSEHPLGKAIVSCFQENGNLSLMEAEQFNMIPGQGVSCFVDGKQILAGNIKLLEEYGIKWNDSVTQETKQYLMKGCTVIYVVIQRILAGYIILSDTIRTESKKMIEELTKLKVQPVLLTGDHQDAATHIAGQLHIKEVHADCLPEHKLNWIEEYQNHKEAVCMIGDGVNDAPALKKANVGIAMGGIGSDIAVDAADIVLVDDDIKELPHLISLSKRMMMTIKCNLIFSLSLNFLAILLAITGVLNRW